MTESSTTPEYRFGDPHAVIRAAADPNYRAPRYPTADDPIPPRPDRPVEPQRTAVGEPAGG